MEAEFASVIQEEGPVLKSHMVPVSPALSAVDRPLGPMSNGCTLKSIKLLTIYKIARNTRSVLQIKRHGAETFKKTKKKCVISAVISAYCTVGDPLKATDGQAIQNKKSLCEAKIDPGTVAKLDSGEIKKKGGLSGFLSKSGQHEAAPLHGSSAVTKLEKVADLPTTFEEGLVVLEMDLRQVTHTGTGDKKKMLMDFHESRGHFLAVHADNHQVTLTDQEINALKTKVAECEEICKPDQPLKYDAEKVKAANNCVLTYLKEAPNLMAKLHGHVC